MRVNELILGVNVALGIRPLSAAQSFDEDGNGRIAINELVASVNNTLLGCAMAPRSEGSDAVAGSPRLVTNDTGAFTFVDLGGAAVVSRRSMGLTRWRAAVRAGAAANCSAGTTACDAGERRVESCTTTATTSILVESFTDCREGDDSTGGTIVLNGRRERAVAALDFCSTCTIGPAVAETLRFTNFTVSVDCVDDCPPGLQNGLVRAPDLTLTRQAPTANDEVVSTLNGTLSVQNRLTGEHFDQQFDDMQITTAPVTGGMAIAFAGGVEVGCLGPLQIETREPIVFGAGDKCAADGVFEVALMPHPQVTPLLNASAATIDARADDSAHPSDVQITGAPPAEGFRETVFRAANGQVYQVLQNAGGDPQFGGEDFRLTTLVGSATDLARCDIQTTGNAAQVVAVAASNPMPLDDVFKSGRIGDATPPCFAPDAHGGAGVVCVGPGCIAESCECPSSTACTTFTIGGTTLAVDTAAAPGARSAGANSISTACASLVAGRSTYAFGGGPTTEAARCADEPSDGVLLPNGPSDFDGGSGGTTLILAYDAPFGVPFLAGSAGFAIDRTGGEPSGCAPDQVVMPGLANRTLKLPPRVSFAGNRVQLDFNADFRTDTAVESCEDQALIRCVARPNPTPTPNPGCVRGTLGSGAPVTRFGTTGADSAGGASCGGGTGGTGSPDFAFAYKPDTSGFYVIDTRGSKFDSVLYVRRGGCGGEELACNDDSFALTSEVGLFLDAGETYVIVVDSFAPEGGDFTINLNFIGPNAPTPTRTPSPSFGLPDLVVDQVTAPSSGNAGGQIDVGARVANLEYRIIDFGPVGGGVVSGLPPVSGGLGGRAGPFDLEFVFSADQVITRDDVRSGSGCSFAGLDASATAQCQGTITVPAALPSGVYFVGAIVDFSETVDEGVETNNATSSGQPIQIAGLLRTPTPTPTRTSTPTDATPTPTRTRTSTPTDAMPTPTPTATTGIGGVVQIPIPRFPLEPHCQGPSRLCEREVCFASYYDLTDEVPPGALAPGGTTFRYKAMRLENGPSSHRLTAAIYTGSASPTDPSWEGFVCTGGPNDGQACVPTNPGFCGADGVCATHPLETATCLGFGPSDATFEARFAFAQGAATEDDFADGAFAEMPLKGMVLWDLLAVNRTDDALGTRGAVRFTLATTAEHQHRAEQIFDSSRAFAGSVEPFAAQEICQIYTLPPQSRLFQLRSLMTRYGQRFDVFRGAFRCSGGSSNGAACTPLGSFAADICSGAPCTGGATSSDSPIYTNVVFSDPATGRFEPPLALSGDAADDRSLTYCVLYDNGFVDPQQVKRRSTSPIPPGGVPLGGPCSTPTHCTAGRIGAPCSGEADTPRNSSCDSAPGAGDGFCDACRLVGGLTTEDGTFALLGAYYLP